MNAQQNGRVSRNSNGAQLTEKLSETLVKVLDWDGYSLQLKFVGLPGASASASAAS
jgi:hypothetical protein